MSDGWSTVLKPQDVPSWGGVRRSNLLDRRTAPPPDYNSLGYMHYPVDKDLTKLILNDHFVKEDVHSAITDGELIETMEGASTLTLNILDPKRELVHGGLLKQWVGVNPPVYTWVNGRRRKMDVPSKWDDVYCTLDGRDFMLANVTKSGHQFALTFENRAVGELRKIWKPKTWYRDTFTRAKVVLATTQEVKGYTIHVYCPELNKIQPISTSSDQLGSTTIRSQHAQGSKGKAAQQGFAPRVAVTVKGAKASPAQVSIIARVLRVGISMGASYRVLVSAIMCITQESDVSLLNGSGGYGPFSQLRNGAWPASVTDVEADAAAYYKIAIANDKQNPNQPLTLLVQSVQRSAYPSAYAQWEGEAKRTLAAFGTQGGAATGYVGSTQIQYQEYNRYAFHRGENGREDSWTFDKRLADEVDWRLFMVNNTLYYVEDNQLIKLQPFDTIAETDDGIDEINYDIDTNKKIQTCSVLAHIDRWMVPPGAVVVVDDPGSAAEGRWLVHEIRYPLFSKLCEITLQLPQAPKPEPAPSTKTMTVNTPAYGSKGGPSALGSAALSSASNTVPGHPELKPGVSRVINVILAQFPGLHINSTTRSGENPNSCSHTAGRACDIGDGTSGSAYMDNAARWVAQNLTAQLCQGIHQGVDHSVCLSVNGGAGVGISFWGTSTWNQHINHLHIAV